MPHAPRYQRPVREPQQTIRVTVSSPEGSDQYELPATSTDQAKRDALRLYAAEHDSPVTAWAEVRH